MDSHSSNSTTQQLPQLHLKVVLAAVVFMLALLPAVLPAPSSVHQWRGQKAADHLVSAEHGLLSSQQQLRALRPVGDSVQVPAPVYPAAIALSDYPPLVLAGLAAFLLAGVANCSLPRAATRPDAARAPPCGPSVQ